MTLLGSEGAGQSGANGTQNSGNQGANDGAGTSGNASSNGGNNSAGSNSGVSWRDSLPDDLKSNASLSHFKDIPSLAKSWINAQEMIGKKGVIPPGPNADEQTWNQFFDSVGRPPLDKYEVKAPKDVQVNEEFINKFKEVAHKTGMLPKQAQELVNWYTKHEAETLKHKISEVEAESKKQIEDLKKEWGQGYSKEIASARLAAKELGGEEFQQYLEETGLGNDVRLVKFLANAGKLLGEDKLRGEAGSTEFGLTKAEAQKKMSQIMGDMSHPYYNAAHPGHSLAVEEVAGYSKAIYG